MKIFISYRRDDSADVTGRIYDRLVDSYGEEQIFKDVDNIPFGVNFKTYLQETVEECDILMAVIGDNWLTISGEAGTPRIHDQNDYVRIEIEAALERDIPVIPLFVRGVRSVDKKDLPNSLKELAMRNGLEIRRDPDFHKDMSRLIEGIGQQTSKAGEVDEGSFSFDDFERLQKQLFGKQEEPVQVPQKGAGIDEDFQRAVNVYEEVKATDDLELLELGILELTETVWANQEKLDQDFYPLEQWEEEVTADLAERLIRLLRQKGLVK